MTTVAQYLDWRSPAIAELIKEEVADSPELAILKLDCYVGRECRELIDMAMLIDKKMFDIMTVLQENFRHEFWNQVWRQMEVWFYG